MVFVNFAMGKPVTISNRLFNLPSIVGLSRPKKKKLFLMKLRKYRNYMAQAKIDKLAEGIPSDLRTIELTGIESTEDLLTKRTKHGIPF